MNHSFSLSAKSGSNLIEVVTSIVNLINNTDGAKCNSFSKVSDTYSGELECDDNVLNDLISRIENLPLFDKWITKP